MAVRLRLTRLGRTHRPFYRLAAMESRNQRDGRVLEELGFYDPSNIDKDAQVKLDAERVRYWLSVGALPTETVRHLLKQQNIAAK
jgi:small subunit ribosomal protein S16